LDQASHRNRTDIPKVGNDQARRIRGRYSADDSAHRREIRHGPAAALPTHHAGIDSGRFAKALLISAETRLDQFDHFGSEKRHVNVISRILLFCNYACLTILLIKHYLIAAANICFTKSPGPPS